MPACFSRPICRLAMTLNDYADDHQRQRLLPYVTRLACADTPEVESARAAYIHDRIGGYYLPSFEAGLQALEGALAIGRQADPFASEEVQARMAAVRTRAQAPESVPDHLFFSKLMNWFTTKETA